MRGSHKTKALVSDWFPFVGKMRLGTLGEVPARLEEETPVMCSEEHKIPGQSDR